MLSIVTGTYNRLETLQRMVQSVRETWPFAVEFVIVDNASQDGTWDWLQEQVDIVSLQMGSPVGAIKAFTEGAYVATGEYVVLATDDIYFPSGALLRAFSYLESQPQCGAVAFAHNKDGTFHTDKQKAVNPDGSQGGVIYPQISMVRRWLGNQAGWWGGRDRHMQQSFTYGGDNYLGSRIIEFGYSADEVAGCVDIEDVIEDAPRQMNRERHRADFDNYWALYPDGPHIPEHASIPNPQPEHLRVLCCLHYNPRFPHHKQAKVGMKNALGSLGYVLDYDYSGAAHDGRNVAQELETLAQHWQPHLVWVQAHNRAHGFPLEAIQRIRAVAPEAVCINWNGDYWPENIENPDTQAMYQYFDLILVQSVYLVERLCELGICAVFMPHSFEPVTPDPDAPGYDVIWAGNGYTEFREDLIATLATLPYEVGLYGRCKSTIMHGETNYNYALQQGMYRHSRVAISSMQFDHYTARGFVSNRLWEIMASGGAVCLQQYVPMLDDLTGLQDGVHYATWHTFDDLRALIDYYLAHPDAAQAMAQAAYDFVHQQHSFTCRIRKVLLEDIQRLNHD
jgi:glycosyltransferase involved in cell wall biosynthesis